MTPGAPPPLGPTALGPIFNTGGPGATATAAGFTTPPYPGFTGTVAQSLRSWPQYHQINWRYFPDGKSHYNALQVSFDRRISNALQFRVAATYSRLMNNAPNTPLRSLPPPLPNPLAPPTS